MISQVSSSAIRSVYSSNISETRELKSPKNSENVKSTTVSSQGDKTRVEQIKDALNNGEYKVNLEMLSGLIADELLQ